MRTTLVRWLRSAADRLEPVQHQGLSPEFREAFALSLRLIDKVRHP